MNNSFNATMLIPLTLFPPTLLMSATILATSFRYLIYKLTSEKQKNRPVKGVEEQPVLILECNENSQMLSCWIPLMFLIPLMLWCFFSADRVAKMDMHKTFFSLNSEQTYILSYLMCKFQSLFALLIFCIQLIKSFTKKVIFYNNAVVVENSIMGRRELPLDESVKRNEYRGSKWIYDERKGINLQVYNKKFMELTHKQEKLLTEIISRIPEKKKSFMLI